MQRVIGGTQTRVWRAWMLAVGLAVFAATPAHAAPLSTDTTSAAVDWVSSTTVHYVDLNDEPGVVDPQFSWDPISRAARYEVEVNSSNDWAIGSRVCCDDKAIGTSLSPVKLLPNNTYYWRMRAIDAAGNAGEWNVWCGNGVPACSVPVGFEKTFDNVTPSIPRLRVRDSSGDTPPAIGASGLPTTDAPVLAWDPVPGASSYELKLAPWDSSLGGSYCNWTSSLGHTFITAATAWTPLASGSLSPVGNAHPGVTGEAFPVKDGVSYCVRLRARSDRDATGAEIVSDWTQIGGWGSAAFTYAAPTLPPCGPTAMPAAAYHDEPQRSAATPRMPLFTWDRVPGACGYYVVVAKDPEFTKVVDVAFTTVPAYAPRTASGPATYTDETTSYYWAVMPSAFANGDGVSTAPQQDSPQPFNKRSKPPLLLSPMAGVTGVPSFRWTAAEGAREYRIQVDDDPYFGTPITDVVTDSTGYTSVNKYPASKTLYWRVRANDENKVGLGWSERGTFTALPPETYINAGPSLSGSSASVEFSSNLGDASFKCKLDGPGAKVGVTAPCTSPATFGPLQDGSYTFSVAAADLAGNADPTPESRAFTVDTQAPDTRITSAPSPATSSRTAVVAFTSTEPGSTFECKLDGPGGDTGSWAACASPDEYSSLADGGYVISVRALDPAGNVDPTPATARFAVDTQAPDTVIATGPDASASGSSVSFEFVGSEAGAIFDCRLDGPGETLGSWARCSAQTVYTGLAGGAYRLSVRASDAAGNTDATPATWTFTLTPTTNPPTFPASPEITPAFPAAPPAATPPGAGASGPVAKRLGVVTFRAPRRPLAVRRGTVQLRFECTRADGCAAATFTLSAQGKGRRPAFAITIRVKAGSRGTRVIAARLGHATRRALTRAGRRGLKATIKRAGASRAVSLTLVAKR